MRSGRPAATNTVPSWAYAAVAAAVLLAGVVGWWNMRADTTPLASAAATETETTVLITGRQVAILDFESLTGDPAMSEFGRRMSEALATALAAEWHSVVGAAEASAGDGVTIAGRSHCSSPMLAVDQTRRSVILAIVQIFEASAPSASSSDAHESARPPGLAPTAPSNPVP